MKPSSSQPYALVAEDVPKTVRVTGIDSEFKAAFLGIKKMKSIGDPVEKTTLEGKIYYP